MGIKPKVTHAVTLSFDDGFRRSCFRVADIYESLGLRACFNVIATNSIPIGEAELETSRKFGTWNDWNGLKARGHEVMPHTYDHQNLTQIPFKKACRLIDECTKAFDSHLNGFDVSKSVYNFAYNASTPELEAYALRTYRAVRTQGKTPINPIPNSRSRPVIGCWSDGPGNSERLLSSSLADFLDGPGGWFVWNTHGLDDEGWGPIRASYLEHLLREINALRFVTVIPAGELLNKGLA
jgi:peptidoglycan/xylan/chitin deacetylase (PgdA/CDA1 family)